MTSLMQEKETCVISKIHMFVKDHYIATTLEEEMGFAGILHQKD